MNCGPAKRPPTGWLPPNSPGRLPCPPNLPTNLPSGVNFWTRLLPWSGTYSRPSGPNATEPGNWNSPSPVPFLPHSRSNFPSGEYAATLLAFQKPTYTLPFGSTASPPGLVGRGNVPRNFPSVVNSCTRWLRNSLV